MPTYLYECPDCYHTHEENKPIENRDDPIICDCGTPTRRQYTGTGIIFNAPGFYSTDKRA